MKRQSDAARRKLVAATADFHEVKDENNELRLCLAALCVAFQMSRPSLVDPMPLFDSVLACCRRRMTCTMRRRDRSFVLACFRQLLRRRRGVVTFPLFCHASVSSCVTDEAS